MNITLRDASVNDRDELYDVIAANRKQLNNMVWAQAATRLSTEKFLGTIPQTDKVKVILLDGNIVGMVALRTIISSTYSIGYWLSHTHRGKGIMTHAVREILKEIPSDKTVVAEIRHNNLASARVLEKNGFVMAYHLVDNKCDITHDVWRREAKVSWLRGLVNTLLNAFR